MPPTAPPPVRLSAHDLYDTVPGLSARQLNYWAAARVFGPSNVRPGSGRHRHFTPFDRDVAAILVRASAAGQAVHGGEGGGVGQRVALSIAMAHRLNPTVRYVMLTSLGQTYAVDELDDRMAGAALVLDIDAILGR